jgi:polysaccharide pyruvyl transferase WcaK-like protein
MNRYILEIEGAFGEKNFGDDALLMVLHRELTKYVPAEQITIRTKIGALSDSFVYLCPGSPVYIPGQLCRVKAKHKVYGGGTQFFDFGNDRTIFQKIKMYGRRAPEIVLRKIINKYNSIISGPQLVHYLGVGIGPFYNNSVPESVINSLNVASTLSVRDTNSSGLLDCIGTPYSKDADICFLENYISNDSYQRTKPEKALIILRDWSFDDAFFDMDAIIDAIEGQGGINFSFALIGKDDRWKRKLDDRKVKYYQYESGLNEIDKFIQHLKDFDVIVSARYHGLVYATLLGIPAIAIELEPKLSVAVEDLKLAGKIGISEFHKLSSIINEMDRNMVARNIEDTAVGQRKLANEMFMDFVEKLKDESDAD